MPDTTTRRADALRDLLTHIALAPGTVEPDPEVRVLAWAGHTAGDVAAAWEPFRRAVLDREAMATGERDWTDADPDAAGLEDAVQRASARVDDAYRLLAWGPDGAVVAA
jgi:hypothetical protein